MQPSSAVARPAALAGAGGSVVRSPWWSAACLLAAVAILIARDPAHLLSAELYAEDGWAWYPDAYDRGPASLLMPLAGYLQTVSRLAGLAAQAMPMLWVPTFFAGFALVIQAAPAAFLASGRMERAWPDARTRVLFALVYLALPNTREVYDNLTNAQWHLAVLSFMVLTSAAPASAWGQAFDAAVLLVSGLSGPFCVVLAPVAVLRAWPERAPAARWRAAIVLAAVCVQGAEIVAGLHGRTPAPVGAQPGLLARIFTQQVLFGGLFGEDNMTWLHEQAWWAAGPAPVLVCAGLLGAAAAALLRGPMLLRHALVSAGLLFAAAMAHPQISPAGKQWPQMTDPGAGGRYYYIPMLAWIGMLFAAAGSRRLWLRGPALALLLAGAVLGSADFRFPERPATDFDAHARRFPDAPPGTLVELPMLPTGMPPMRLVKHP